MLKYILTGGGLMLASAHITAYSQFNLDGQYIIRTELRNGYGRLIPEGADPAAFVAHRARLQASYTKSNFTFLASVQDIRTWGNTPQTKISDNNLSVHEAWIEGKMSPRWSIKLGRQELNYDNARFLGNLDWALQARAHDFALVKYEAGNTKLHFGGGFNQDAQHISGNTFTIPNQYKAAQMARLEHTWGKLHLAMLFWNDGRQYVVTNSTGQTTDKGVRYRQTIGIPALRYHTGKTTFSAFYYHQLGRVQSGAEANAYDVSAQLTQQFNFDSAATRKLRITAGLEILSGTSISNTSKNRSFSPLYGTNHAHNGYMDYFYVGGAHENNVGLQDYYLRTRIDFNTRFFTQLDGHLFYAHADVYNTAGTALSKYLGTEADLSLGYLINDAVSVQGGYSHFFYSTTIQVVQNNFTPKIVQNWAYLMLIFRPNMKNKFIGILL